MFRKILFTVFIVIFALSLAACTPKKVKSTPKAGLPNPASVDCEEHGSKLDIRQDATGGQVGICVFPNGSECHEWAYYRNACAPADSITQVPVSMP